MESLSIEKKKFIKHVLMNAPPGKLDALVADLKILFGSGPALRNFVETAIMNYDEANYSLFSIDDKEYVITCKESKMDKYYVHPRLNLLVLINHSKRKVIETKEITKLNYSDELEGYRKICDEKLQNYVNIYFSKWNEIQTSNFPSVNIKSKNGLVTKCGSAVFAKEEDDKYTLSFIICAERHYLKNYHSSSWRSVWFVTFSQIGELVVLTGTIDIAINYFEDANMNFQTSRNFEKSIPMIEDFNKFSSNIMASISEYENLLLYDLNNFLLNINVSIIKNTRKILPMNGEKFDWKNSYQDITNHINRS